MDGSHRSSVSSFPKDVDETENEENQPQFQLFDNLQTLKKESLKNYMSSTISAASKAIAPRKKILSERNEASEPISFDAIARKNTNLNGEKSPKVSHFEGSDDENEEVLYKPYDPITNFLSPRPQFLRYNPNRRREILQDGEDENEEMRISSSGSSSVSLSSDSSITTEIETNEVLEESAEIEMKSDEEEEEGCFVEGGIKTMFLLVVLILSALIITVVNSFPSNGGLETYEIGNLSHKKGSFGLNLDRRTAFLRQKALGSMVEEQKRSFEEMDSGDEMKNFEGLGSEEALNKVVGDSDNKEVSQDQEITFSPQHQDSVFSPASKVFEEKKAADLNLDDEAISVGTTEEFVPLRLLKEVVNFSQILLQIEAEFALKILIGVVTFFTAVAYFFLGLQFKTTKAGKKGSKSRSKPRSEPQHQVEQETKAKKDLFSASYSQPSKRKHFDQVKYFSTEKVPKEYQQSHAPSVALLAEFEVKEINSSMKKNSTKDSRLDNLSTDSSSFRSQNVAQKKTDKNENFEANFTTTSAKQSRRNGQDPVLMTPVRRSSRIRNRSVISP